MKFFWNQSRPLRIRSTSPVTSAPLIVSYTATAYRGSWQLWPLYGLVTVSRACLEAGSLNIILNGSFIYILSTAGIAGPRISYKIKIKINRLTACRLEDTGRAHPKKSLDALGGPTLKKTKKFLVVVAHFLRCANTTDLSGGSKRASTYLELPCHTASITLSDIAQKCSDTLKPQKFCMVSGGTSR